MCIMAPQSKKLKGSFTYQATFNNAWFHKGDYKGVITNTERDTYGAYCFVYHKSVSTAHQGEKDLNLLSASPENGQTHSSNSSAVPDQLYECV